MCEGVLEDNITCTTECIVSACGVILEMFVCVSKSYYSAGIWRNIPMNQWILKAFPSWIPSSIEYGPNMFFPMFNTMSLFPKDVAHLYHFSPYSKILLHDAWPPLKTHESLPEVKDDPGTQAKYRPGCLVVWNMFFSEAVGEFHNP